ncbi:MAG TPA: aminotransferase class I/II-fold pyridoxal phosphate-dependent enzyme, partial [Dehalococcoidia bacterium]|nr:aminotransferase class I/II-fold pyridoxal phosphate-dependent enzyme [Dehalococcoidia bacterium]
MKLWRRLCGFLPSDFMLGNPHEPPLPGFMESLGRHLQPLNDQWYAYKENETASREVIANSLRRWRGLPFDPEDIFVTNGSFAGLSIAIKALAEAGDEVIFISPPWFFYESLIAAEGATPVRVKCDLETFDLDLDAIADAISERTSAIIINSPHNPTGKIYPEATLRGLAELLRNASVKHGRPVFIVSDEAYCRIVYDGRPCPSPISFYEHSFLIYTYGKTL